jgi:hypothetical protein
VEEAVLAEEVVAAGEEEVGRMAKYILIGAIFFGLVIVPSIIVIWKPIPFNFKGGNSFGIGLNTIGYGAAVKYIIEVQYPVVYSFENPAEGLITKNVNKLILQMRKDVENNPITNKIQSASSSAGSKINISYDQDKDDKKLNISFDISTLIEKIQKLDPRDIKK